MKQIINGKTYNTETAERLASDSYLYESDFRHWCEALYRKKTGEFFLSGSGGPMSHYSVSLGNNSWGGGSAITPLSEQQAKNWMEKHGSVNQYENVFGVCPE